MPVPLCYDAQYPEVADDRYSSWTTNNYRKVDKKKEPIIADLDVSTGNS